MLNGLICIYYNSCQLISPQERLFDSFVWHIMQPIEYKMTTLGHVRVLACNLWLKVIGVLYWFVILSTASESIIGYFCLFVCLFVLFLFCFLVYFVVVVFLFCFCFCFCFFLSFPFFFFFCGNTCPGPFSKPLYEHHIEEKQKQK